MYNSLIISYDFADKDIPCLTIFKKEDETVSLINWICGKKAVEVYNILIGETPWFELPIEVEISPPVVNITKGKSLDYIHKNTTINPRLKDGRLILTREDKDCRYVMEE